MSEWIRQRCVFSIRFTRLKIFMSWYLIQWSCDQATNFICNAFIFFHSNKMFVCSFRMHSKEGAPMDEIFYYTLNRYEKKYIMKTKDRMRLTMWTKNSDTKATKTKTISLTAFNSYQCIPSNIFVWELEWFYDQRRICCVYYICEWIETSVISFCHH